MRDKLIFLMLFLLWVSPVEATEMVMFAGSSDTTVSSTEFSPPGAGSVTGSGRWTTNELQSTVLIPSAGTISNLRAILDGTPASGDTRTLTIRHATGSDAMADSSVACTVTDASSECQDTGSFNVSAGDRLSMGTSQTGGCCNNPWRWSFIFDSTTDSTTILTAGSFDDSTISNANRLNMHGARVADVTQVDVETIFPLAGTLKNFYVRSEDIIGVGNTITLTIVDSSDSSTGIACTLTNGGGRTCNDTSNTQAVLVGERYGIKVATSGTNNTHGALFYGIELVSTTEGQFGIYESSDNNTIGDAATEFLFLHQSNGSWSATESSKDVTTGQSTVTLQHAYAHWSGTNGAGDTMTFTLRVNTGSGLGDTDLVIVLAEGDQTGNDIGTVTVGDDDLFTIKYVQVGTPDVVGDVRYSVRAFIDPGIAGLIKTWNGLAWGSVKTFNGLAVGSIKTINGVATQ